MHLLVRVDGKLDIGDELMAVNSKNLQNLKHTDAVHLLKTEGPQVILTIRSNPVLRGNPVLQGRTLNCILTPPDMFAEDVAKDTVSQDDTNTDGDYDRQKPLPQGWSEKIDQQTGRPYYEW